MGKKDIMGKYALVAATGIVAALLASPVYAQAKPASAPPATADAAAPAPAATAPASPPAVSSTPPVEDKAAVAKRFADDKQKLLTRIDDLMAKTKERRTCVAAAADRDALRACFVPPTAAPAKGAPNASGTTPVLGTPPAAPSAEKK